MWTDTRGKCPVTRDVDRHRGKCPVTERSDAAVSPGPPGTTRRWGQPGKDPSQSARENTAGHLYSGLPASRTEMMHPLLFSATRFMAPCDGSPEKLMEQGHVFDERMKENIFTRSPCSRGEEWRSLRCCSSLKKPDLQTLGPLSHGCGPLGSGVT